MAKTSKSRLAEQALRALAGGDVPRDFHVKLRELILLVPQARDHLVEQMYRLRMEKTGAKEIDTAFLSVYKNVPILTDEDLDLKYSELPASFIDLPDGLGLYHVGPMKGHNRKFKKVPASFLSMYDGLEASNLHGNVGFWVEGDKIYYTSKFDLEPQCEEVLIKLVGSISDTDDDDEIEMPRDIEMKVISLIVEFYNGLGQKPKDRVNDNLPQQ